MCGLRSDRPDAGKTRARCFGVGPKAQRGSRFVRLGDDLNREGILFASSVAPLSAEKGALGDQRHRSLLRDR